jgi:4-carboxymuconolactone decarboxylase
LGDLPPMLAELAFWCGCELVAAQLSKGELVSELSMSQTPVLDLLASMTTDSVEASSLDPQAILLVRLAALVASDAPSISYALNLAVAGELGLNVEDVRGVLTAIAPIVGTSRVAAATGRIVEAIDVALEVAEVEMAAVQDD